MTAVGTGDTPATHYQVSPLPFPEVLPSIEYLPHQRVRIVQSGGLISLDGKDHRVGKGLKGHLVGISQSDTDGVLEVRFVNTLVRTLDLRQNAEEAGDKV